MVQRGWVPSQGSHSFSWLPEDKLVMGQSTEGCGLGQLAHGSAELARMGEEVISSFVVHWKGKKLEKRGKTPSGSQPAGQRGTLLCGTALHCCWGMTVLCLELRQLGWDYEGTILATLLPAASLYPSAEPVSLLPSSSPSSTSSHD